MYSKSQLASNGSNTMYALPTASGHGVFIHHLYLNLSGIVLNDNRDYYAYKLIERVKKNLLQDERTLQVNDPGAGSDEKMRIRDKKISVI